MLDLAHEKLIIASAFLFMVPTHHSMARANLNKSKFFLTSTNRTFRILRILDLEKYEWQIRTYSNPNFGFFGYLRMLKIYTYLGICTHRLLHLRFQEI